MGSAPQAVRLDPYRAFNFLITLVDSSSAGSGPPQQSQASGGFSECSGLDMSLDIEEYKEGGNNGLTLRFPTRVKWSNLRLKRGIATNDDLWLWHFGYVRGQVLRKDGVVTLLDEQQNPVKSWSFTRGLPVKWAGPSLNAAQNQIAIEELEIAHEGLRLLE
jgi:phage tail-like protein